MPLSLSSTQYQPGPCNRIWSSSPRRCAEHERIHQVPASGATAAGGDWLVTLVYVGAVAMMALPPRIGIVVVVVLVALGETTGVYFGRHIRDRINGERTLAVDSALGSVLQAATVVVAGRARGVEVAVDVVVTGSHGFIGGALIPRLRADGHRVLRLVQDGRAEDARFIEVTRMRLVREYSGLWLLAYKPYLEAVPEA